MGFLGLGGRASGQRANIAELEAKVAAIYRSQAVIEFKLDGTILAANGNFLSAVGYAEADIVGRHHSMFVDPADAAGAEYRRFWERLGRGEFFSDKYKRLGKGGREIWIQASYNPLFDETGKPFKVIKFAADVTEVENERRRNEEERASLAAEQATVVDALASGLKNLASGNLSHEITVTFPPAYESLRVDFNKAIEALRAVMTSIASGADAVRGGTTEITRASDDLSKRTEQTAATLEQTAAALNVLTETVRQTADGARKANETVSATRGDAERSGEIVRQAVAAMEKIEQSASQISQIIGVIDEIAFQTNLLALNAGVEAARAGDAGRGFAVVAQEVRALAQRSAEAAKEIKALISASADHVGHGVSLVGNTGEALMRIVASFGGISELVAAMATSAETQATGIAEINIAIGHMDQSTQQNAAMVEQSTAAAYSLAKEADSMATLVGRFEIGAQPARIERFAEARPAPRAPSPARSSHLAVQARSTGSAALKHDSAHDQDGWEEF